MKRIELSPTKIVPASLTVWNQPSLQVDLTMDLKNITFQEGSVDEFYAFHVLDHLFENEIAGALASWKKCLKPGGALFVIVDDFEYLCRSIVGGDMLIDDYNQSFTHPTNITHDNLLRYFKEAGFPEDSVRMHLTNISDATGNVLVPKQSFELIFSSTK